MNLHQDKTLPKARAFSEFLNRHDYQAVPDIDGTRDYLAKIDIHTAGFYIGKLNVYYSPKKDSYKITCQSITVPAYHRVLEELWQQFEHQVLPERRSGDICAYVDGSFLNGRIGYGAVILRDNELLHEISGGLDETYSAHHQIGGELKAVLESVTWCKKNKIGELHIYYDYKGIEMWAKGKWKAKNDLTQKYQEYMIRQEIVFHFHKIAAHTGNRWNDYADQLAKKGTRQ